MNLVPTVLTTLIKETTPSGGVFPSVISGPFFILNKVHQLWRWHLRTTHVCRNTGNFGQLVAGTVVNVIWGKNVFIRIAARVVLAARCLADYIGQQNVFLQSYYTLIDGIKGRYWLHIERKKFHGATPHVAERIFSRATVAMWRVTYLSVIERVKRVVGASKVFAKEGFVLSMRLLDLIEAFSFNDSVTSNSVNEVFVNTSVLFHNLLHNVEGLLEQLEDHKPIIRKVLLIVRSPFTVENIIDKVKKTAGIVTVVEKGIQKTKAIIHDAWKAGIAEI